MKMKAEEKAMVVCNEAGVDTETGAVFLVATMCWIYTAIQNLSEVIINAFK